MAWNHGRALRVGDHVSVLIRDAPTGRERTLELDKYPGETEAAFILRGQEMIRSWVDGLERQRANEVDVTSIFRPPTKP